ncbi:lipoyl(octanoyl) transferase LIP2 [Aspergillus fijiensis CBS 313.89]|uniref:Octanoyltransferase n=1 Tax=Aspergillus fijiensis CBS 313.89 TaxID=1448319 RepID=A0A8G1VYU2_9EURO|nr:lipoyltransferase [Aspergillus fijiensis CBS 313.89]RAK76651.1 lipoyltransferase [Aspergillus fijiensis CBS 313.89]
MRLAHIHYPDLTSFTRISHLQQTLTTRLLTHKKLLSSANDTTTPPPPPPDPTIITFTPHPVYTTGRRDLPPSNTSPRDTTTTAGAAPSSTKEPQPQPQPHNTLSLSLPPPLEQIRPLLIPPTPYPTPPSFPRSPGSPEKAEYHPTLRGGQTTYHGPGQMVAYTILDLRRLGLTPRCHIRLLENSVIDVLASYGVRGLVTEDPGVWVHPPAPLPGQQRHNTGTDDAQLPHKITAVGVHLRRNISSFGIGFNVTQEPMWWFRQIVACGLEGREATSLAGVGVRTDIPTVAGRFVEAFVRRVNRDFAVQGGKGKGEGIEEVYTVAEEDLLRE